HYTNQSPTISSPTNLQATQKHSDEYHDHVLERFFRSPGPAYDVQQSTINVKPRTTGVRFSRDDRAKYFVYRSIAPGPKYVPNIEFLSQKQRSHSPTIPKFRRDTGFVKNTPFEGHFHDLIDSNKMSRCQKQPNQKFGHDDRAKYFVFGTQAPGVGKYNLPQTVGVKKTSKVGGTLSLHPRDTSEWIYNTKV
ncbi:MAG: hypothetical protein EZS28_036717, partial [Streblomastix strix]